MPSTKRPALASLLFSLIVLAPLGACFEDEEPQAQQAVAPPPAPAPARTCTPTTCLLEGRECGDVPDGCGDLLRCGSCADGKVCGASVAGRCGTPCLVSCPSPLSCSSAGTCTGDLTALVLDERVKWDWLEVTLDGQKPPVVACSSGQKLAYVDIADNMARHVVSLPIECRRKNDLVPAWTVAAPLPAAASNTSLQFALSIRRGDVDLGIAYDSVVGKLGVDAFISTPSSWRPDGLLANGDVDKAPTSTIKIPLTTNPTATATGEIRVNGQVPAKDGAKCAQYLAVGNDPVLATLRLQGSGGQSGEYAFKCSSADWKFSVPVVPGKYDVFVEPSRVGFETLGVNLMPVPVRVAQASVGGTTNLGVLNEVGVRVYGTVTADGAPLPSPPPSLCALNPEARFGFIELEDPSAKVTARIPLGCANPWSYDVMLPAAAGYTPRFAPAADTAAVPALPIVPTALGAPFQLSQEKQVDLMAQTSNVTLMPEVNNQPLLPGVFCINNPDAYLGTVVINGPSGRTSAPFYCTGTSFAPRFRLSAGKYTFALQPRGDIDTGLGRSSKGYILEPVTVAGPNPTYTLRGYTSAVFVNVTTNNAAPTFDGQWCKAHQYDPMGWVHAYEKNTGLELVAELHCLDGGVVRFDLPPGTYDFKAEGETESKTNLPAYGVRKSSVVVNAGVGVHLDVPLVPVEGRVLFGGALVQASVCGADAAKLVSVLFFDAIQDRSHVVTLDCASQGSFSSSLAPGLWDVFLLGGPTLEPQNPASPFAPYDYLVMRQLAVEQGRR